MGKLAKKRPKLNPKSEENLTPINLSSDDEDLAFKIVQVKEKGRTGVHALENMETKEDVGAPKESDATTETDPSEKSNNIVLQKLLRGPRYFDPPDNSWGNCYNCGESGHTTANCTSAKRKKPCFVCGSFEHHVKQCSKGKECFICKKGSHRAKDCPEKSSWRSQSTKVCLNCGDSGHEMFSCENMYSPDDLKEIQCYVCKCFGHLCCVNYAGEGAREVSCYRCGQLGHSGRECARVHAETASKWTPSSCYMCGKEAHTVCRCTANAKKQKRKRDSSTPKKKNKKKKKQKNDSVGKYGKGLGARSMPQPNRRGRGGGITKNPSAYNHNHNHNHNHEWGSFMTPPMYISNDRFQQVHGGNSYQSPNNGFQFHGGNGYRSPNNGFQFHGGNGYQPPNNGFQFHGGNGYQPPNNGFQFHGGNGYQSPNNGFQFHGGSGYNSSGYDNNPGMFHAAGSNGYQQASRFGNYSNYGRR